MELVLYLALDLFPLEIISLKEQLDLFDELVLPRLQVLVGQIMSLLHINQQIVALLKFSVSLCLSLVDAIVHFFYLSIDFRLQVGEVVIDLLYSGFESLKLGVYSLCDIIVKGFQVFFKEVTHYLVGFNPSFGFCDHNLVNVL